MLPTPALRQQRGCNLMGRSRSYFNATITVCPHRLSSMRKQFFRFRASELVWPWPQLLCLQSLLLVLLSHSSFRFYLHDTEHIFCHQAHFVHAFKFLFGGCLNQKNTSELSGCVTEKFCLFTTPLPPSARLNDSLIGL